MSFQKRALRAFVAICVLGVFGWAGTASAQMTYSLTGANDGSQGAIGNGLPLPIQFFGPGVGTGMVFPPMLIPATANATVKQTPDGAGMPWRILGGPTAKDGIFHKTTTNPIAIGVVNANDKVWQVETKQGWTAPHPTLPATLETVNTKLKQGTFRHGGFHLKAAGVPTTVTEVPFTGGYAGFQSAVFYRDTSSVFFGGVSQGAISTANNPVTVWGRVFATAPAGQPCEHPQLNPGVQPNEHNGCKATMLGAAPKRTIALGGPVGWTVTTPGVVPAGAGTRIIKVDANGLVLQSAPGLLGGNALFNDATSTAFPWTAGQISLQQPNAVGGAESFAISGTDQRNTSDGEGLLQMVAGALSTRMISMQNANRGWIQMTLAPEPSAALGAAAALGVLALCHGLVRRRSR